MARQGSSENTSNKSEILRMSRPELVNYLENCRGMMCRPEESKKELMECAMEDAGYKKEGKKWVRATL
ncbi:hypothetical protein MASR1M48_17110 [Lactococcus petauri]